MRPKQQKPPIKPGSTTSPEKPFLLDSADGVTKDMPGITKLLNRKKLGFSKPQLLGAPESQQTSPESEQVVLMQTEAPATGLGGARPKLAAVSSGKAPAKAPAGPLAQRSLSQFQPVVALEAPTSIAVSFENENAPIMELTSPQLKPDRPMLAAVPTAQLEPMPNLGIPSGGTLGGTTQAVRVQIVPSTRASRPQSSTIPLTLWTKSQIQTSTDPVQVAVNKLLKLGAQSALFLSLQETRTSPRLTVTAALGSQLDQALWKGLKWDTSWTAQVWPTVSRSGMIEIRPDEPQVPVAAFRLAFGLRSDQWLSLLRVGNSSHCAGVVVIISNTSLQEHLPEIRSQLANVGNPTQLAA